MVTMVVLVSAAAILLVSVYLALCRRYDDGIIGNAALAGMSLASASPLYEALEGSEYDFVPTTGLMYAAVAVFMLRHAYRFRRWSKTGNGEWSENGDKSQATHRESQA